MTSAEGKQITLDDMAGRIGISRQQLLKAIKDGYDTVPEGDLSSRLSDAYRELLHNVTEVGIIEDINMIVAG